MSNAEQANAVIEALGGTTAVAKMICAPVSTVHSWRKIGIPASRLAHLKLAASAAGKARTVAAAMNATPTNTDTARVA